MQNNVAFTSIDIIVAGLDMSAWSAKDYSFLAENLNTFPLIAGKPKGMKDHIWLSVWRKMWTHFHWSLESQKAWKIAFDWASDQMYTVITQIIVTFLVAEMKRTIIQRILNTTRTWWDCWGFIFRTFQPSRSPYSRHIWFGRRCCISTGFDIRATLRIGAWMDVFHVDVQHQSIIVWAIPIGLIC